MPLSAIVLVWPILFFVPGWVVIRRVAPRLPVPGAVGAAIVTSVYVSAHLVNVVARVGGFGRASIVVAAVLLALASVGFALVRSRWLAPLERPTRAGFTTALRADAPAWIVAIATGLVVLLVLGTNGWVETPDGWVSGGWNWSDFLVHVSIGSSIAAGNFPPEVPYFAGEPLTYHWFADFHGAITSTVAGVDIIGVYFLTSALFAGVLALVVWALAMQLTARRSVATIAAIIACATGGLGWIRLVGDVIADKGDVLDLVAHWSYDNTWADGWPYLQDRVDLQHRLPAPPRHDARAARARRGRPARRRVRRPAPGRRPARRDPGRAPRAVPVLRLPGDLSHRRPVRPDDRRLAPADGGPRRRPVPRAGGPRRAVHR